MNKIIIGSGFMFAIAGLLTANPATASGEAANNLAGGSSAKASDLRINNSSRSISHPPATAAPIATPLSQNPSYIGGYAKPTPPEILNNYGLVQSVEGEQVSVRLLNGKTKTYQLASSGNFNIRRGGLVGFDTNSTGKITRLAPPQVKKIYRGTLIIVEGTKVGMVTPKGERFITTLSKAKIARMGLAPGQPIKMTQYKGTWATKVCQPGASNDDDSQPIIADQGAALGGPIELKGQ